METKLTPIKRTKSVIMNGDREGVSLWVSGWDIDKWIPIKKVFQVKRGLESYVQRFYRKAKK